MIFRNVLKLVYISFVLFLIELDKIMNFLFAFNFRTKHETILYRFANILIAMELKLMPCLFASLLQVSTWFDTTCDYTA